MEYGDLNALKAFGDARELSMREGSSKLQNMGMLQQILERIQQQDLQKQFAGAMGGGAGGGTPEQLDALAAQLAAKGHPGAAALSGLADKRRQAAQAAAETKAQETATSNRR